MSVADEMEKTVDESVKKAERLRQSILNAQAGVCRRVVPQDPSDEPAEKLLERIKAEKAEQEIRKNRKTRRMPS